MRIALMAVAGAAAAGAAPDNIESPEPNFCGPSPAAMPHFQAAVASWAFAAPDGRTVVDVLRAEVKRVKSGS